MPSICRSSTHKDQNSEGHWRGCTMEAECEDQFSQVSVSLMYWIPIIPLLYRNLFGIDYIRNRVNVTKKELNDTFVKAMVQQRKVRCIYNIVLLLIFLLQYYTEKGAYNKANGLPPQLDGTGTLQTQTEEGAQLLLNVSNIYIAHRYCSWVVSERIRVQGWTGGGAGLRSSTNAVLCNKSFKSRIQIGCRGIPIRVCASSKWIYIWVPMSSDPITISAYKIQSIPLTPQSISAKFLILGIQPKPAEINRIFQNSFQFRQVLTGADWFRVDSHWGWWRASARASRSLALRAGPILAVDSNAVDGRTRDNMERIYSQRASSMSSLIYP